MAGCGAAGVGVLDDDDGGIVEFLREFPAGVEIDEVVVAEFFALELGGSGDAEAGAVSVESGALVGVFAVAERLGEGHIDAQGGREAPAVRLIAPPARWAEWARELRRSCRACWRWRSRRRRWWQRPAWQDASGFRGVRAPLLDFQFFG